VRDAGFAYDPPAQHSSELTYLQETAVVGDKVEDLSRIAVLEPRFATRPGVVEEQRRRHQLILYVTVPL